MFAPYVTVPEGLQTKAEPEALGMIATCQCHLVREEDFTLEKERNGEL